MTRGSDTFREARLSYRRGAGSLSVRTLIDRSSIGLVVLLAGAVPALGLVNLELRPVVSGVGLGQTVDVGMYAVSDTGFDELFGGMEAVLIWNPSHLVLQPPATNDGGQPWFLFGFISDSQLDGLNDSYLDGDALFQAASIPGVMVRATPAGELVATLRFIAVGGTPTTTVRMEESFGSFSVTQVLASGGEDLTGTLTGATVTIADVREFADLQVCYTGNVGPVDPPAYSLDPSIRCEVFDLDDDGDVDSLEYQVFVAAMSGDAG